MGGLTVVPDCLIDDMVVNETSVLLLPGADTWRDPRHDAIIKKAGEFLASGATVCAICGATAALADCGLLIGMNILVPEAQNPFLPSCRHCRLTGNVLRAMNDYGISPSSKNRSCNRYRILPSTKIPWLPDHM